MNKVPCAEHQSGPCGISIRDTEFLYIWKEEKEGDKFCELYINDTDIDFYVYIVVVQLLSCVQLFVTPWTTAYQASLSFTISWSLLKLMSTGLVMLSNCLFLCLPLFLLPSIFPPSGYFSVSALHIRWPKYCSFSPRPSKECSGLTSFRIDWFDLLAVQGTCKSLLQHHNLKALVL